jgi:hypothetical protein
MITADDCLYRYGRPESEKAMIYWDVPKGLEIGVIPKKLYCNKELVTPLTLAFTNLILRGFVHEMKTFDGCFNIRRTRNGVSQSLHSWGVAIDVNAAWNRMGHTPSLSAGFVQCFKDAGFDWGGDWKTPDGMHFQLATFPK